MSSPSSASHPARVASGASSSSSAARRSSSASAPSDDDDDATDALETNRRMATRYRSARCPRWRLRRDPADGGGGLGGKRTPRALMYDADGGAPFERASRTRDGIAIWTRASSASAAKEILAEVTFPDTPRDALWRAVCDVERYREFVPFVKRCDVVRRSTIVSGAPTGASAAWVYNEVKPPVASARDYTIKIESTTSPDASVPHVSSWSVDDSEGPGPRRGIVRLTQNSGRWELRSAGRDGRGTALTYRVLTDPGASLPGWLIDIANQNSVPDVLRAFKKRAESGLYEREDVERENAAKLAFRGVGWGASRSWRGVGDALASAFPGSEGIGIGIGIGIGTPEWLSARGVMAKASAAFEGLGAKTA